MALTQFEMAQYRWRLNLYDFEDVLARLDAANPVQRSEDLAGSGVSQLSDEHTLDTAFTAVAVVGIVVSLLTGKTLSLPRASLPEIVRREKEPGAFWFWVGVMGFTAAYFGFRFATSN